MSFWITDEGKKHRKKDEELIKKGLEKKKTTPPKEYQIECPRCKTLNEPNSVLCASCGENMVALKETEIKDYSVLHQANKKRKRQ
jgi:hypothetical protein